jgi:uncharacterized protein YeaO (DUF488 family)
LIKVKRVYDATDVEDGIRFLVDRLWPRGKWSEFRRRYFLELKANPDGWRPIAEAGRNGVITLVYAAGDKTHNNAVALREFLTAHLTSAR